MRVRLLTIALLVACNGNTTLRLPPPPPAISHEVQTSHFVLHTDLDATQRDFYARLFEGFRAAFVARFHELPPADRLPIYLFGRGEDYAAFVASSGGPRVRVGA